MERKGLLFDYGGTLDTGGCHWGRMIWHAFRRQHIPVGFDVFSKAYVHAERVLGSSDVIQPSFTFRQTLDAKLRLEMDFLVSQGYWLASPLELESSHASVLADLYGRVKEHTAESRAVLLGLKGRCRMALVSNFYGNISEVLAEFGLDGIFENVIESAAVGVRKPDARIFGLGAEALGLQPQNVIVVGDSIAKDIVPAKSLGCTTVWLKGEAWEDKPQDAHDADFVIERLGELVQIVERLG